VEEDDLIMYLKNQINKFEEDQVLALKKYNLFNFSELFSWGICMDNELMTIRWWSSMIKPDNEENNYSKGVNYKVSIINKSSINTLVFNDLRLETLGMHIYYSIYFRV
jgi:hypothetical protein